jgi:hypothetical protein
VNESLRQVRDERSRDAAGGEAAARQEHKTSR